MSLYVAFGTNIGHDVCTIGHIVFAKTAMSNALHICKQCFSMQRSAFLLFQNDETRSSFWFGREFQAKLTFLYERLYNRSS